MSATERESTHRRIGRIFADVSIDDAARDAVRFSRGCGGGIVITLDESGECTAHVADMPATDRYIARHPSQVVGAYEIKSDQNQRQMRAAADRIAEDIWHANGERRLAA